MARGSRQPPPARGAKSGRAATVFVVFCAALMFCVVKGAALGPAPASASEAASAGPASRPDKSGGDERVARAAAVLRVVNGHVALWRLQHGGRLPNFDAYPDWEQFLQATDRAGWPSGDAPHGEVPAGGEFPIGPYLARQPVNPL